ALRSEDRPSGLGASGSPSTFSSRRGNENNRAECRLPEEYRRCERDRLYPPGGRLTISRGCSIRRAPECLDEPYARAHPVDLRIQKRALRVECRGLRRHHVEMVRRAVTIARERQLARALRGPGGVALVDELRGKMAHGGDTVFHL